MKYLITLIFVTAFFTSFGQNEISNPKLIIWKTIPNWASNLISINLGTYYDALKEVNMNEKIIGFLSWGDQRISKSVPYSKFLFVNLSGNEYFLKFISTKKEGKKLTHTFESERIKLELIFDGIEYSKSGVGSGGKLHLYFQGKKVASSDFWSA